MVSCKLLVLRTNHAPAFDFPEALRKSSAPRQVVFIEDSYPMGVYITPEIRGLISRREI
jgi:hypothetical protein